MTTGAHRYTTELTWAGSTGVGYDLYDRNHVVRADPSPSPLVLSSDPAFRGDPSRLNPEQLVVLAASSCQLLSFLAVAARGRVDVRSYTDRAEALMPEDDPPTRITSILLSPTITVRAGVGASDDDALRTKVERFVRIAHDECYIANSLRTDIRISPTIQLVS